MLEKINKVKNLLEEYYIDDILIDEDEAISIMVNSQDDKFLSFYLPGLFDLSILGLRIKYKEGYYTVVENMEMSFIKILKGDRLLFVNNIPVISFFKKKCKDEFIKVQVVRKLDNNVFIIEETVKNPIVTDVSTEIVHQKIHKKNNVFSYIKFATFNEELNKHLRAYSDKNTNLILDISDHLGGNMNCMINCLKLFLKDGEIAFYLSSKGNSIKPFMVNNCSNLKFNHIFIVINEHTSSSAEIFCASLKDCLNATVLGRKSYGKNIINKNINIDSVNNLVIPIYRALFQEQTFKDGVIPDIIIKGAIEKDKVLDEIDRFYSRK